MSIAEMRELRFCSQWAFKHTKLLRVPLCVSWAFLVSFSVSIAEGGIGAPELRCCCVKKLLSVDLQICSLAVSACMGIRLKLSHPVTA